MIIVTEPTPFGLNDMILMVEVLRILKKEFFVFINRFGSGDNEIEKYCKENNIKIIGRIDDNRKIAELYSQGKLLYKEIPEVKKE